MGNRFKTDETDEVTGKPIYETTYHTEPEGKGSLVKRVQTNGDKDESNLDRHGNPKAKYYDKDSLTVDELIGCWRANNSRLTNNDLEEIRVRWERMCNRMLTDRKAAKRKGYDLITEDQANDFVGFCKALLDKAAYAAFTEVGGHKPRKAKGKTKKVVPQII